jgi:hypothetical protein
VGGSTALARRIAESFVGGSRRVPFWLLLGLLLLLLEER